MRYISAPSVARPLSIIIIISIISPRCCCFFLLLLLLSQIKAWSARSFVDFFLCTVLVLAVIQQLIIQDDLF